MAGLVGLPPIEEIDGQIGDDQREEDGMSWKPRVTSTREAVYGWYPPQWNIYSKPNYKQWDGYNKDYAFNGWYNAYSGAPGAKVPAPPGMGRPPKSPAHKREGSAPVRHSMPSFRLMRPQTSKSGQDLKRQIQEREVAKREQEQGLCVDTRDKSPTRSPSPERQPVKVSLSTERAPRPSPSQMIRQSWQFNKPHDYVIRPMEGVDPIPKPDLRHYGYRYGTPDIEEEADRPRSAVSPSRPKVVSCRPVRSATVRRPKFPSVPDMEKFKEELRRSTTPSTPLAPESEPSPSPAPSVETVIPEPEPATTTRSTRINRVKSAPPSVRTPSARPESPTPNKEAPDEEIPPSVERPATAAPAKSPRDKDDSELTYEELVDKYGWKVQIPGDPLNLKKGIIRERLSCTVGCSVPESKKDPPKVHREVWDTFFLNTIPRKPMTFTIAPDWVSEVLHAKRMELQKREGINYRYKDFAFVY